MERELDKQALGTIMTNVGRDATIRWSCRHGDYLMWFRFEDLFSGKPTIKILDYWVTRDGDYILITNRWDDLPVEFPVHRSEVLNVNAHRFVQALKAGYKPPDEPADGPNIWRLQAGDRLVWLGEPRCGHEPVHGILAILECVECVLAFGERTRVPIDLFEAMSYGAPPGPDSKQDVDRCRLAVEVLRRLGPPREVSTEWRLG